MSKNDDPEITLVLSAFDEKMGPIPLAMTENWDKVFTDEELFNVVMWAEVSVGAFDRRAGLGEREGKLQGPLQIPVSPDFISLIWPWMVPAPDAPRLKRGRLHCLIVVLPVSFTEMLLEHIPQIQEYLMTKIGNTAKLPDNELEDHALNIKNLIIEDQDYINRALRVAKNSD